MDFYKNFFNLLYVFKCGNVKKINKKGFAKLFINLNINNYFIKEVKKSKDIKISKKKNKKNKKSKNKIKKINKNANIKISKYERQVGLSLLIPNWLSITIKKTIW